MKGYYARRIVRKDVTGEEFLKNMTRNQIAAAAPREHQHAVQLVLLFAALW